MGMFDYVRSSYYFDEDFKGQCQTKDIEDGIGGSSDFSSIFGTTTSCGPNPLSSFDANINRRLSQDAPLTADGITRMLK